MFLEGIVHQLEVFATTSGVKPEDVTVRLVFNDGDVMNVRRLKLTAPFGASQWGMIQGDQAGVIRAVSIREADVLRAEFQLPLESRGSIGFSAERHP